jgi:hypothetical protein
MALDGRVFELEMKLKDRQEDIQDLAKRQDALEKSLENAKFGVPKVAEWLCGQQN